MEQRIIKCGENFTPKTGDVVCFATGAFATDSKGQSWVAVEKFTCYQGKDGLIDENGNPIDYNSFAVRVSKKAEKARVAYMLKHQK